MMDRMDRVSEALKREISLILQNDIDDPRVEHITVNRVEPSRDLSVAKVYYMVSAEGVDMAALARGLKRASGFIRKELAAKLEMKYIPRVEFREDKGAERVESVDRIFDMIEKEHDEGTSEE